MIIMINKFYFLVEKMEQVNFIFEKKLSFKLITAIILLQINFSSFITYY